VLWNPGAAREITRGSVLSKAGFDLFEGSRVTGWPAIAIRGGEVVFRDGRITAEAGSGRVPRRGPTVSYRG
jgi:dihydropyrimidinase